MEWVEPLYNRLTVFDSRYPHGVRARPLSPTHPPLLALSPPPTPPL